MKFYKELNKLVVTTTMEDWADSERWSTMDTVKTDDGEVMVSTAFLGVNHRWSGHGDPLVYETMMFGDITILVPMVRLWGRYSTRAEAEKGHAEAVAHVRSSAALENAKKTD